MLIMLEQLNFIFCILIYLTFIKFIKILASGCVGISIAVQLLLPCYVILILLNLFCIQLACLKFAYFANVSFLLSILIIRCVSVTCQWCIVHCLL